MDRIITMNEKKEGQTSSGLCVRTLETCESIFKDNLLRDIAEVRFAMDVFQVDPTDIKGFVELNMRFQSLKVHFEKMRAFSAFLRS
jgi:hypothetical protein